MVWIGSVLAAAGVAVLRLAWGRPKRSVALNAAGWALLALGLVVGGMANGAWGVAIVSIVATACAFLALTHAGITSKRNGAKASVRRANLLDAAGEPLHLGRRLATFLLTVPLALGVALLVGLAARTLAGLGGWHEANGNVLTLFLMPVVWAVLLFLLLMTPGRRKQALYLLVPAVAGGIILAAGSVA